MPGETRQTTTQQSQTRPWEPGADAALKALKQFDGLSLDPTQAQRDALATMSTAASATPNFGYAGMGAVSKLFNTDVSRQLGLLNQGYDGLNANIGATARGEELNPYLTPGFSDSISRMTNDITNKVKGQYAAAGRDPSGAGSFAGSLGRGLTEGIAPVIQGQFNQNNANRFNAAGQLYNAAGTTASGLNTTGQIPLQNGVQAMTAAGQVPGLLMQPGAANFDAATRQAELPWQSAQRYLSSVLPIAALGQNSNGTSETVRPQSTASNIMGGLSSGLGMLSQLGGAGGAAGGLSSIMGGLGSFLPLLGLSDERAKDNIQEVGATHDGQPLYSYTYKGEDTPQIGLLAQDVEKRDPGAVVEVGGWKVVDYNRALKGARVGLLNKEAA